MVNDLAEIDITLAEKDMHFGRNGHFWLKPFIFPERNEGDFTSNTKLITWNMLN